MKIQQNVVKRLPKNIPALSALCALMLVTACAKDNTLAQQAAEKSARDAMIARIAILKQGKLRGLSAKQIAAHQADLPYYHEADNAVSIGMAKEKEGTEKYIKNGNLVFKAIVKLPAANTAAKNVELNLELINVKILQKLATALDSKSTVATKDLVIAQPNQIICVLNQVECSGEALDEESLKLLTGVSLKPNLQSVIASDEFNQVKFSSSATILTVIPALNSVLATSHQSFKINLLEKFGLAGKPLADQLIWINAHSVPFSALQPDRRVMSFAIGNSFYADSGTLSLDEVSAPVADEDQADSNSADASLGSRASEDAKPAPQASMPTSEAADQEEGAAANSGSEHDQDPSQSR